MDKLCWNGYRNCWSPITGVTGAIIGCISYRKSSQNKALDLRLELKRAIAKINSDFKILLEQMIDGDKSRKRLSAARGRLKSVNTLKWKEELKADQATVKAIGKALPAENSNYDILDPKSLEEKLIETHKIHHKITILSQKYREAMKLDDEQRRNIQENMRTKINR